MTYVEDLALKRARRWHFHPAGLAGYVFPVTGEVITEESAEHGDAEERGYVDTSGRFRDDPDCWSLRDLLEDMPNGRWGGDGSNVPRWIMLGPDSDWWLTSLGRNMTEGYEDALGISLSVHRPDCLSDASWLRVCRLLGWRPYREINPAAFRQ